MTDLDDLRRRAADLPVEVHGDGIRAHVVCADAVVLAALKARIGTPDSSSLWLSDPLSSAFFGNPVYVGQCPCAPTLDPTPSTPGDDR